MRLSLAGRIFSDEEMAIVISSVLLRNFIASRKNFSETFQVLKQVFGYEVMSRAQTHE
jgi:hypothetical protein